MCFLNGSSLNGIGSRKSLAISGRKSSDAEVEAAESQDSFDPTMDTLPPPINSGSGRALFREISESKWEPSMLHKWVRYKIFFVVFVK